MQVLKNKNRLSEKKLLNREKHIQKRAWYEVDIPFTDYHFDPSIEGLKTAANLTKDTALAGGKFVYDKGKAFLVEQINRIAPGLLEFLNGDWKEIIKSKISSAIDKLFGKLISKVQTMGLIGIITNFVGQLTGDIIMASSNLAAKTQAAVSKASRAIFKFVSSLSRPLIKAFQKVSGQFVSVLGGIWNKLALPAFEAVQSVAGSTWTWLKSKAEWVWKQIVKVKNLLSEAWDWIKVKFNIAWAGAGSVWSWIKDKIKAAWDAVYAIVAPLLGPLNYLKSVFKLFNSKGPLASLGNAATSFWNYAFLLTQFINFPKLFIQAGVFLKNVVLPALLKGLKKISAFLTVGFTWLVSVFQAVSAGFKSLTKVLKGVILSVIKAAVKAVEMVFDLVKSLFIGLVGYLVEIINEIINDFWGFLFRLATFLGGIVLIILNPANWFPFAAAVFAKIAWTLIPRFLKPAAIDFLIKATLTGINALPSSPMLGPLWKVLVRGMTGLLRRIQKMDPDRQIKFVEKLINTGINPRYYSGFQIGVIKGIVWDGLVGLFMTIVDIFRVLPELISGIYNFFKEMLTDVPSIKKFLGTLKKLGKDVEKFLKDPKALDQIVELIKKSPQILFSMVRKAFEVAKTWANEAGDKIVESLFAFVLNNDAFNIGLKVGTVVGMILFEILLLVFSGTIGNIVKWGGKALRLISSGLKALVKGIQTGGGLIMKGFRAIGTVASAGWKVITKVVKGGLAKVFNRMKKLMDDLVAWFKKLFQRAFSKKKKGPKKKPKLKPKPTPGELAAFNAFKTNVLTALSPFRIHGISKKELRRILRRARRPRRIKRVVKMTRISYGRTGKNKGKYLINAIVDFLPGKKKVGKVERLPTGESRNEAISIHWYKRGHPNTITTSGTNMQPSEWNPAIAPPPAPANKTFAMSGGEIEVPSRRYRSFPIAKEYTENRNGSSVTIKKVKIGVAAALKPYIGKKMKRTRSSGASRSTQDKFRNKLLAPHGFNWQNMEADHVQDLAWGGSRLDVIPNLWPLSKSANNAGNEVYRQQVHYQIGKTGNKGTQKPDKLFNKWFKIRSLS